MTQAEASERLGVGLEIVQRLVELGLLVDYERSEGYQRHWHQRLRIVRRTEFHDLQARWRDGIPLVDVARLLELDRDVVENLVNGNLLTSHIFTNDVDDRLEWKDTASLNTFVRRLNRFPATPYNFGEPVILRDLIVDGHDLVEILRLAISGDVRTMWHGGGLDALWVSENDVNLLGR